MTSRIKVAALLIAVPGSLFATSFAAAERAPVLKQIKVPHDYYFREMYLPQLTTGPSSVSWSPDAKTLIFSMQGSLWRQSLDSGLAVQLTAGPGYDYQPDWSPDGKRVVFVRYNDDAMELHTLDLESGKAGQLTTGGAVNLEPRWSPDGSRLAFVSTEGTGRFHVFVGTVNGGSLDAAPLLEERESEVERYYYSSFDHELSPSWSPDGDALLYVGNPEIPYGTGAIWRRSLAAGSEPVLVHNEETTWKARPDWSPDGKRFVYSSYLGRQWNQLWAGSIKGTGYPFPLTYGDYDVVAPRWSPDGLRIAYIANESGNTELRIHEVTGGSVVALDVDERRYLKPMGELQLEIADQNGAAAARVSVVAADGRSYAPDGSWMHADDSYDRELAGFEAHYFHTQGSATVQIPAGAAKVTVWRGLEHGIETRSVNIPAQQPQRLRIELTPLDLPDDWASWQSGDVHVHMNYGGSYRNTPERLVRQAGAEDLDLVFNLVVNKEQRVPDIDYFSPDPDSASTEDVLLVHSQEYHTSYWGHMGLLGLNDHYLIPGYVGYPATAAASLYPDNAAVADLAHAQQAAVGYVHPFGAPAPDPETDASLTNALPIDAALGKVDYYEVVGFADHRASAEVWYRLLNCGFHIAAAGGTDAMANYASLRGPVGVNRTYVRLDADVADPAARRDAWLAGLRAGHTLATNGPLLGLTLDGQGPGAQIDIGAGERELRWSGFMRSIVPMDHLELVYNGEVVETIDNDGGTSADFQGTLRVDESGWLVLRAWNDGSHPMVFDLYPYATTSPVYVVIDGEGPRSTEDAEYFIAWIERVRESAAAHEDYNSDAERAAVLAHLDRAVRVFEERRGPR